MKYIRRRKSKRLPQDYTSFFPVLRWMTMTWQKKWEAARRSINVVARQIEFWVFCTNQMNFSLGYKNGGIINRQEFFRII